MEVIKLKEKPRAYHATFAGGWEAMRRCPLGLAPASHLLDLYDYQGDERAALERRPRSDRVQLKKDGLPDAWLRDQKPIAPPFKLADILLPGTTEELWCLELNRRSYFFLDERDVKERLLAAYPEDEHDLITVDRRALVDAYEDATELCSFNSGAIGRAHKKRGIGSFVRIADYPTTNTGRAHPPVKELTVTRPIPDIERLVKRVIRWRGGHEGEQIFP